MKMDSDTLLIDRIIDSEDDIIIKYSFIRFEQGWSFNDSELRVFDDKGNEYDFVSSTSSTYAGMQEGYIEFAKVNNTAKYLIIKLDWYDRQDEIKVFLDEEGENNEA